MIYDLAIIGLGINGSLLALEAAERGLRTIAFEQHLSPHHYGSSHGGSRLFRRATLESEDYLDLATVAETKWWRLSEEAVSPLVERTGTLIAVASDATQSVHHGVDNLARRARQCADRQGIEYEWLGGRTARGRFGVPFMDGDDVYYEPGALAIRPEIAVHHAIAAAAHKGAVIRQHTSVASIQSSPKGHTVTLENGDELEVPLVAVAAGGWSRLLPGAPGGARFITPQVVALMPPGFYRHSPAFVRTSARDGLFYVVPSLGGMNELAKVGIEQDDYVIKDPDQFDRKQFLARMTPRLLAAVQQAGGAPADVVGYDVCLYSMNDDSRLLVYGNDVPSRSTILSMATCSGHGFKYAPAFAEGIIDIIRGRETPCSRAVENLWIVSTPNASLPL